VKQEAMIQNKVVLDEREEESLLQDNVRGNDQRNSTTNGRMATNGRRNRRKLKFQDEDNNEKEGNWNIYHNIAKEIVNNYTDKKYYLSIYYIKYIMQYDLLWFIMIYFLYNER